jgi:hypothetical protein
MLCEAFGTLRETAVQDEELSNYVLKYFPLCLYIRRLLSDEA